MVYATGLNTFFGRAAALLGGAQATANLQKVGVGLSQGKGEGMLLYYTCVEGWVWGCGA